MAEIRIAESESQIELHVSGAATVAHAAALKTALLDALQRAPAVRLVIEDLEAVDLSFLQLLCAAHRTAEARNRTLTLSWADPGRFSSAITRAGFQRRIGCQAGSAAPCFWECGADHR